MRQRCGSRMTLWRRFGVVALASLSGVACTSGPAPEGGGHVAQRLPDGRYDLITGEATDIERIRQGVSVADEHSPFPFYKLRVPAHLVEEAFARTDKKVRTISMEDPHPDVEVTVHNPRTARGSLHVTKRPGDAWVTGTAQVLFPGPTEAASHDPSVPAGLFEITVYTPPAPNAPTTAPSRVRVYNGHVDDPAGLPVLKYTPEKMGSWPPLPEHWK